MSRVRVLVIDGQGGGLGRQLTAALAAGCPDIELTAVGTNSIAASAMLKAGAHRAATGENAVVVNCRRADIIVGPIGIVIADSLLGEITPAMAAAVCQSSAARVLIPINHCDNIVVGVPDQPIGQLVAAAVEKVSQLCLIRGMKVNYGQIMNCKIAVDKHALETKNRCGKEICPLTKESRCRYYSDMGGVVIIIK